MFPAAGLVVVVAGILSTLAAEGLNWLLIYRTEDYQKLRKSIDTATKRMDKMKDEAAASTDSSKSKVKNKAVTRHEQEIKMLDKDLARLQARSGAAVGLVMLVAFYALSTAFNGVVVAKLPFVPLKFITHLSHRGLEGDDYTECSVAFLYALCAMGLRTNVQKALGYSAPKSLLQVQAAQAQAAYLASKKLL